MKKQVSIIILLLTSTLIFSQEKKKDTIGTEVINVVKPYTPTVSDAFKIKLSPEINDAQLSKKRQIE